MQRSSKSERQENSKSSSSTHGPKTGTRGKSPTKKGPSRSSDKGSLTSSLEDYLETIFELVRDRKLARVKDIAKARGVRSASVSPAMARLADMGMVKYMQREYVDLTAEGERVARRIYARHQMLERFLGDVLGMSPQTAEQDACAMEHSLSDEGMDHLVRFFEFLTVCPEGQGFVDVFHRCSLVNDDVPDCGQQCEGKHLQLLPKNTRTPLAIADLRPGSRARIVQVEGDPKLRKRLLDMGMLPDIEVTLERWDPVHEFVWLRLQGFTLSLKEHEARAVLVEPLDQ